MSSTYCVLPFIHFYARPNGEVRPCCIADAFDAELSLKTKSIDQAFNSSQMQTLRKDMLEGRRNKVCQTCYVKEDLHGQSPRLDYNKNHSWEHPAVAKDFSVESQFQYIDIRFSNLCNFKCRMCCHEFSSNWFDDMKKLKPEEMKQTQKVIKISDNIIDQLIPHLKNLKYIYFAGGEPLIMPEHYQILEYLYNAMPIHQEDGLRHLSIYYNTNLSVVRYNENDLLSLWQGFNKVFLSISCDGIGKVGEYQRTGFKHDTFIDNLKNIKKYFSQGSVLEQWLGLGYGFQYTTTIWNVYHIFDFIDFMKSNNFIDSSYYVNFHYATMPSYFALNNLSAKEKIRAVRFLEDNVIKLRSEKTKVEIKNIIEFINSPPNDKIENLIYWNTKLDNLYSSSADELNGVNFSSLSRD